MSNASSATSPKAASLSGSLLARKGTAAPAGMIMLEPDLAETPTAALEPVDGTLLLSPPLSESKNNEESEAQPAASLLPFKIEKSDAEKQREKHLSSVADDPENGLTATRSELNLASEPEPGTADNTQAFSSGGFAAVLVWVNRHRWISLSLGLIALSGLLTVGWNLIDPSLGKHPATTQVEKQIAIVAAESGDKAAGDATEETAPLQASDDAQASSADTVPEAVSPTPVNVAAKSPAAKPPVQKPPVQKPSVDIVRIETDGTALIAGRAGPKAELIVLDNGDPIGVATADSYGEWVFLPTTPLRSGSHEFSLVVKTPGTMITLPPMMATAIASGKGSATVGSPATTAPIPARKPLLAPEGDNSAAPAPLDSSDDASDVQKLDGSPGGRPDGQIEGFAAPPDAPFVIQLASVKSPADAEREWQKLQRNFPDVLANMKLRIDEATVRDKGTFYRIRTGPFTERAEAQSACAAIAAAKGDCLVVRRQQAQN